MPLELFYKEYKNPGSDQTLIILHGLFGMLDNWHKIASELSKDVNVVTVDLRNHGKSPQSEEMSLQLMCEDLTELLSKLGLRQAMWLGHSMGGKVLMAFAENHPQLIESLIIVDIAPKAYESGHEKYFDAFKKLDFSRFSSRSEADSAMSEIEQNAGIRMFLLKNLERSKGGGYHLKFNLKAIEGFYPELLRKLEFSWIISIPCLVIRGSESDYISDKDYQSISETFSESELLTISGAGHWVHADQPELFIDAIRSFVDR
jgi:pimeloyl-ACP methyl ester carboxylesterase